MSICIGDRVKIINNCAMLDKRCGVVTHKILGTDYLVVDVELAEDGSVVSILSHDFNLVPLVMDFLDDEEKMRDFLKLTRQAFLLSYNYISEEEYDATLRAAQNRIQERTKLTD